MRYLLLLCLLLISTPAYAGISVCHSGEDITRYNLSSSSEVGCLYFNDQNKTEVELNNLRTLLTSKKRSHLKVVSGEVELKPLLDRTAIDDAEQAVRDKRIADRASVESRLQGIGFTVDEIKIILGEET